MNQNERPRINFTQFCVQNNYPSDYDTMFEAQLLGSRGLAGRISKHSINSQDERFHEMQRKNTEAHRIFYEAVKSGSILDSSGELTAEKILKDERDRNNKTIQSQIESCESYIKFVSGMSTSYLNNGKFKKSYQRGIDHHLAQIKELKSKLQ